MFKYMMNVPNKNALPILWQQFGKGPFYCFSVTMQLCTKPDLKRKALPSVLWKKLTDLHELPDLNPIQHI